MVLEDRREHAHTNGYSGFRNPNVVRRIVLHSTRSGVTHSGWTQGLEMSATINWFQSPNSGVATHLVISPAEIVRCLFDGEKGHHAGTFTWNESFGIELTQPTVDTPYEQGHYDNLRKALEYLRDKGYSLIYTDDEQEWLVRGGIIFHENLTSHKSDPGYMFNLDRVLPEEDELSSKEFDELMLELKDLKKKNDQLQDANNRVAVSSRNTESFLDETFKEFHPILEEDT